MKQKQSEWLNRLRLQNKKEYAIFASKYTYSNYTVITHLYTWTILTTRECYTEIFFNLRKWEKEKAKELDEQWKECERLKLEAIEKACAELTRKLRNEFALEREQAVGEALAKARVRTSWTCVIKLY